MPIVTMEPLNHVTKSLVTVITVFLCHVSTDTFKHSTSINKDIARYSTIAVTSECSSGSCNKTCPYRDAFPTFDDILVKRGANCSDVDETDLPPAVNRTNSAVHFNDSADCLSVNPTVVQSDKGLYSISFWMKANCTSCQILQYGNITLNQTGDSLIESISGSDVATVSQSWTHLVLRYDGTVAQWFVNGVISPLRAQTTVEHTETFLVMGPDTDLSKGDFLSIVDARFYKDILTDREIRAIHSGSQTLEDAVLETNCRCPPEAPTLNENSTIVCNKRDGTGTVTRLNIDGGYPEFINDGEDQLTCWKSANNVQVVNVKIALQNVFQVAGIAIHGLTSTTDEIKMQLQYEGQLTQQLTFQRSPCGSEANCHQLTDIHGSLFVLNDSSISARQDVTKFLADTVSLTLSSTSNTQFTICEINLGVSCHCWGNDPSCVVNKTDYACTCMSNTIGENCQNCTQEYYRQDSEFSCMRPCNCNMSGSEDNICNEIGGQCSCKANVNERSGRTCDECKFNTVNLGSDDIKGCTSCPCNPQGIQYCASNQTCICKNNTETDTVPCDRCLPNHYGLDMADGCHPCACHKAGTKEGQSDRCNDVNGTCTCKTNVGGRQCDTCLAGWYNLRSDSLTGCEDTCGCSFVGSLTPETCDIVSGNCSCLENRQHNRQCLPEIFTIGPLYGPIAGGTNITVTGMLLGNPTTSILNFYINRTSQHVVSWNSTLITITTEPSNTVNTFSQSIAWTNDSWTHRTNPLEFEYKKNPVLQTGQTFFTYESGGCGLRVRGNHINSTYSPKLVVHTNTGNAVENCAPVSDAEMLCPTPNISQYNMTGNIRFGFMFDDYRSYEVLDEGTGVLTVINDPTVTAFTDYYGNTFTKEIRIQGERLNSACGGDVMVLVGKAECKITSIADDLIVCDIEESFPGTTRDDVLVVEFGNLRLEPGKITFKDFWNTQEFVYIAVGVGCFVLIVIVIIVLCCVARRRRTQAKRESLMLDLIDHKRPASGTPELPLGVVNPIVAIVTPNQTDGNPTEIVDAFMERLHADVRQTLKLSVVGIANIKPGKVCTKKGGKMRIINGTFTDSSGIAGDNLTIKTNIDPYRVISRRQFTYPYSLDPNRYYPFLTRRWPSSQNGEIPDWLENGLRESTRMRDFVHEHVLASCGLSIDAKYVYVLYPEMTKRTLKDQLTMASQSFDEEHRLDICVQVAEGMNFLDGHHIVHKDLAARNCWVNSEGIVKIADASFATDLYPDEYLSKNGLYLPVRWMAPESLRQIGFYHSKSDVWSFGVVMWEVFTNGYIPYHDITNSDEIADLVCKEGYHLGKPHDCSDRIFSVIELCLSESSDERPNFFLVTNHLTDIISPQSPISYVNEGELQEDIYQNTDLPKPPLPPKQRKR